MKKKNLFLPVSLLVILCCGCSVNDKNDTTGTFEMNTEEEVTVEWEKTDFPETYQYSSDNLKIDLTVMAPDDFFFLEGEAQKKVLDYEQIGRYFMPESEENTLTIMEEMGGVIQGIEDENGNSELFTWHNGSSCDYTMPYSYIYNYCVFDEGKDVLYNLNAYAEKTEFDFATEEEAMNDIIEILSGFGIEITDEWKVNTYYLNHEILQEEEFHMDMNGNDVVENHKTDWSEENDAYLFYFHPTYCNVIDYHHGEYGQGRAEDSFAPIRVIYTKNGIEEFYCGDIYNYIAEDNQMELKSFDEIAQILIQHYESILNGSMYEVNSVELCCDFKDKTIELENGRKLIPVWVFDVTETTSDGMPYSMELRINAATGGIE